jgi:hypothetical protein
MRALLAPLLVLGSLLSVSGELIVEEFPMDEAAFQGKANLSIEYLAHRGGRGVT